MKFLIATLSILLFYCGICRSHVAPTTCPTVETHLGTLEGVYRTSSEGVQYQAFLGVPYAESLTPEHKFEVAKPAKPWTGVRQAQNFGPACIQLDFSSVRSGEPKVVGSEDCLTANIYTPAEKCESHNDLLSVIIFIQGGGFQCGDASEYGADYLMKEGVVLVTFNNRIGPLGFLSTEDDTIPGNMGLKDQVLLMRWVQENIRNFCGNPKRVTLVGHGAGAFAVHSYYTTKQTEGLFHRGVLISGNALLPWAQAKDSLGNAKKLAAAVECPTYDVKSMVDCLKTRSAKEITLASAQFLVLGNGLPALFAPVVERGRCNSKLIYQQPIDAIITGEVQDLPLIIGDISGVGVGPATKFLNEIGIFEELDKNWAGYAPALLGFDKTIPKSQQNHVSQKIRNYYLGRCSIDESKAKQITEMMGDRWYKSYTHEAARQQAKAMKSPVRVYKFVYKGEETSSPVYFGREKNEGNSYADDVSYVLKWKLNTRKTHNDREVQKLMINIWVSFAKGQLRELGKTWHPLHPKAHELEYLEIAGPHKISMKKVANYGNEKFWQSIPFDENIPTREPRYQQ